MENRTIKKELAPNALLYTQKHSVHDLLDLNFEIGRKYTTRSCKSYKNYSPGWSCSNVG